MSHGDPTVLPLAPVTNDAPVPKAIGEQIWTIVVGGGSGRRFGRLKQFEDLGGRPVIDWSTDVAASASDGVVVVVPRGHPGPVVGGASRSASVANGLAAVPATATIICVHDAARPFAPVELFAAVVAAVRNGADGAIPGVAVTDTIKVVDPSGGVAATPDRASLVAVQTPQAFRAGMLRRAYGSGLEGTDDAALVEAIGGRVVVVPGEAANRKITHPDDLVWARQCVAALPGLAGRSIGSDSVGDGAAPAALQEHEWDRPPADRSVLDVRSGQGFDIHRFSEDPARSMVLGGCLFEGLVGLHGHSDADAVAHAVTDALLGAAGLGDIGEHFPDTDPQWKGADSVAMLRHVAGLVRSEGWRIGNVDCSVVCEVPKLAPRRNEMQSILSAAAGAPVTVKGRRAEGLGALGRSEGIAVWAVAVISRMASQ